MTAVSIVRDMLESLLEDDGLEKMRSLVTSPDLIQPMRGYVENTAKLLFTDQSAGVTINLWPWIIFGIILVVAGPLIVGILSNLYVPMYNIYKAASSYGRSDYDEYYDDDGYDRYDDRDRYRDRDFRRRRKQSKRPREDDYYNVDWKDDYYRDWDRQSKQLPDDFTKNMVVGFTDTIANAVKLIN